MTRPEPYPAELELARLRRRLGAASARIDALSGAVDTLRRGTLALRRENEELRRQLAGRTDRGYSQLGERTAVSRS